MREFHLAFKAYDVHELGCHFVARYADIYRRHGLEPRLIDATFLAEEDLPPDTFHAACAGALAAWLLDADTRVVFVAADRPMFWLYAAPGITGLGELQGEIVASYPAFAPPAHFLREVWMRHGYAASCLNTTSSRDDVMRVGLLKDGTAKAALLSSAVPPAVMHALGFRPILSLGDELRLATTGLAVSTSFCRSEPELITKVCACYRQALALIRDEPEIVAKALMHASVISHSGVAPMVATLRRCYTPDGHGSPEHLANGVDLMARALDVDPRPAADFYDFAFLT